MAVGHTWEYFHVGFIYYTHCSLCHRSEFKVCLSSLHIWFCCNDLANNQHKSEEIAFKHTDKCSLSFSNSLVDLAGMKILISDKIKALGVTIDSSFTID